MKLIWIYWRQGFDKAPFPIPSCVLSWKKHNPDWDVRLICEDNISDYLCPSELGILDLNCSLAHQSDILRLMLLVKFGGVWVDSTCYCTKPLSSWLNLYSSEGIFLFSKPGKDRLTSNWFIYADQNSYQLKIWLRELLIYYGNNEITPITTETLIERITLKTLGRNTFTCALWYLMLKKRLLNKSPYYATHYALNFLYYFKKSIRKKINAMPVYSSDSPHYILTHGLSRAVDQPFIEELKSNPQPLYKLSYKFNGHNERSAIEYILSIF